VSGGSYDYAYSNLEYKFIDEFRKNANTPQRKAFLKHMEKVTKAMHDIEWVDSGDYGPCDENDAIMACISKSDVVETAVADAQETIKSLGKIIEQFGEVKP
jgi:hypothetical protein